MLNKLKYFEGAKPGQKRSLNKTAEEVKLKHKKYEENRPDRKFNDKWKIGREWLEYENELMKCSTCIKFYEGKSADNANLRGRNTFLTGSSNLKISAVTDHEYSKGHLKAVEHYKSKSFCNDEVLHSSAGQALMSMKSAERHRLAYLFRNVHAIAKHNRPITDYSWLCSVDKAKGLDIGDTYLNEKAALCFLSSIADITTDKTLKTLEEAPFFSFLMDGSTDIAGEEQESVYVRCAVRGSITERFLYIGSPKSTCAADLKTFVTDTLDSYGIEKGKLVGMGSDGASNMVGSKSGLATRMRQDVNKEMINIHCLCHRLELSFRDVMKTEKLYDKLMTLLVGLHYFYKKQYKNKTGLINAMEAVSVKGLLPPKVTGTRWLPHLSRGINSLLRTYKPFEAHLSTSSHDNAKAEGLYKLLTDRNLMTFAIFLKDSLDPLMKLSLRLQKDNITLSDSLFWIETTASLIDDSFARNSDQLTEILDTGVIAGVTLKGQRPQMAYRESMIKGLSEALRARFQLESPEKSIINATRILSIKHWPIDDEAFTDFGCEEIKLVTSHFSETLCKADEKFDAGEALNEWQLLKMALKKRYGSGLAKTSWTKIHEDVIDEEMNMVMLLINLLLSLPPTSVSCETSFSQMKLVKTSRRTKLQAKTLNNLMIVKLQSPDINEFNPDDSIDKWLTTSAKPRKLGYKRREKSGAISKETEGETGEEESEDEELEDAIDTIDFINELCGGGGKNNYIEDYENMLAELAYE